MFREILVAIFYFSVFNFLIYRFSALQFRSFRPFITHLVFNLKFASGILVWLVYTFYYKDVTNNDVHKFYNDALVLHEAAFESPGVFFDLLSHDESVKFFKDEYRHYTLRMKNWERNFDDAPFNENRTIIRLNALLMFLSLKTYLVHILFFCFFSLAGWVLITNCIFRFTETRNAILALPVLFLPSVLFWTSGVMKEALLIFGLGLVIHGILCFKNLKSVLIVTGGVVVVLFTKFFVLLCLLPAVVSFLLFRGKHSALFITVKYVFVSGLLFFIAVNIHSVIPSINPVQVLIRKQTHSIKEAEYYKAGSMIDIPELEDNSWSILEGAVNGIWNTIFRPYLWESENIMMVASAAENLFVVFFLLMCFSFRKRKQITQVNLIFFLITLSLSYFAVTGMCTPVLGNLVRYKTPVLPFFIFAFILAVKPKAVADSLSFILRK